MYIIYICVCECKQANATRNVGTAENTVAARVVQAELTRVLFRSKLKTEFIKKNMYIYMYVKSVEGKKHGWENAIMLGV